MPITVNLPNNDVLNFPDDMPEDQIREYSLRYAKENGLTDPSLSSLFGAGIDSIQSALSNLPLAGLDKLEQNNLDTDLEESEWKEIFDTVRNKNKESSDKAQSLMVDPTDALKSPLKFAEQQLAFQAPQMIGLLAANAVPGGQVIGPAAMQTYFTATNLDRQKEEKGAYDLTKAFTYATGQTASEAMFMKALKFIPEGKFLGQLTKAAATGIGGEVFQQGLERASADLDLTSEDAMKEYVDSAIAATVFVGAGAPISYYTTRSGTQVPLSEKTKEKLAKGESVKAEDLVEEQISTVPDEIEVDGLGQIDTNSELPEDVVKQSEDILTSANIDKDHFKTAKDKVKAASVVMKNVGDNLTLDEKVNDLIQAGVEESLVRQFEKENAQRLLKEDTNNLLAELANISVEEADSRLNPVYENKAQIIKDTTDLVNEPDTYVSDTDIDDTVSKEISTRDFNNVVRDSAPELVTIDEDTGETVTKPTWADTAEGEGLSRMLNIKQKDVKQRLVSNINEEGYRQFIPTENKDTTLTATNQVDNGADPSSVAQAQQITKRPSLNRTLTDFAANEQSMINYKRAREVKTKAPIDQVPMVSFLERVQPLADKVTIDDSSIGFLDKSFRQVSRALTTRGRGFDVGKVSERVKTDPIYKVQLANFIDTVVSKDTDTLSDFQKLESFYYLMEHTPALNATDKKQLIRSFKDSFNKVAPYFGLDSITSSDVYGPETQKEFWANVYNEYFNNDNKAVGLRIPKQARDVLRKVKSFEDGLRKEIKNNKVKTTGQLVDNIEAVREQRLQIMNNEYEAKNTLDALVDAQNSNLASELLDAVNKQVEASGGKRYNKAVGFWVEMRSSLQSLAKSSDLAAKVLSVVENRDLDRQKVSAEIRGLGFKLQDIESKAGAGFITKISERIHRMEEAGDSYDLTTPGEVLIKNKKGEAYARIKSNNAFDAFTAIDSMKKFVLDTDEDSIRNNLAFFGIKDRTMSPTDIQRFITLAEGQNNINLQSPDSDIRTKAREVEVRLESLKNINKNLMDIQKVRENAWFPRVRSGSMGIAVYKKGEEGRRQSYFASVSPDSGVVGGVKPNKIELEEHLNKIKSKFNDDEYVVYGFDGTKYKPSELNYDTFKPINMTFNSEMSRHGLNSLVSACDLLEDMGGLSKDNDRFKRLKDTLEMRAQGNFTYFGDRRFIEGYEVDPLKAIETFSGRFSNHSITRKYAPELREIKRSMKKYTGNAMTSDATVSAIDKHLDFVLDPQESFGWMKTFNYLSAMGGSLKSALVQLTQSFTFGTAYANAYNLSPVRNAKMKVKAMNEASKFIDVDGGLPAINIDNPNAAKEHFNRIDSKMLTKDQKKFLGSLANTRFFESITQKVFLEGQESLAKTKAGKSALRRGGEAVLKPFNYLNSMIGNFESYGRLSEVIFFTEMFTNQPNSLKRFEKSVEAEPKYQNFKQDMKKRGGDDASIAALYLLDDIYLVTGSTGKTGLGRSGIMNIVSPFANFATQALGAIATMFKRNKLAFAQMVMLSMIVGGLNGIPFWSNIKEFSELLFELTTGGRMDLELEVRDMLQNMTGSDNVAKAATKGLPYMLGIDYSSTVSTEIPLLNNALKVATSDPKLSEVANLPTSALSGWASATGDLVSGGQKLINGRPVNPDIAKFVSDVVPYKLVKDIAKAVRASKGPTTTKNGKALLPSQEGNWKYLVLQGLGFTPAELQEARAASYFKGLASQTPKLVSYRKDRNELFVEYYKEKDPQRKQILMDDIRYNAREAYKEAVKQGVNFNLSRYMTQGDEYGRSIVTGVEPEKNIRKGVRQQTLQRSKEIFGK